MWLIIRLVINAVALYVTSLIVTGMEMPSGFFSILLVVIVFGLVNTFIKPVIGLLTLPLNLLTLGLFTLVINALMLMLTAALSGLDVAGFWPALWGGIILSLVSVLLNTFLDR